jgi:hypothetical protein
MKHCRRTSSYYKKRRRNSGDRASSPGRGKPPLPHSNENLLTCSNLRSPRLQTDKPRLNHCYVSNYRRLREGCERVFEIGQTRQHISTNPTKLGMKVSQTFGSFVGCDRFVKEAYQLIVAQRKLVLAPVTLPLEDARAHFASGLLFTTVTQTTFECYT